MGCNCGKPKCDGQCGCKSPAVLQINNPAEYITFHKVSIPAAMGDSTTNPPKIGAYRNALVYYEADHTSWMYSTDGIPTLVTGEQGIQGEPGPQGIQGIQGPQGEQGHAGANGADGFSPTATVVRTQNGATITITDAKGTTTADVYDGNVADIPIASANVLGAIKVGPNLSITADGTLSADAQQVTLYSSTGQNTDGAMTQKATTDALALKADISSLAPVATSGDYNDLSNLPTPPTVNNGALTIQQNGTTVGTFTANSSDDKIVNIQAITAGEVGAITANMIDWNTIVMKGAWTTTQALSSIGASTQVTIDISSLGLSSADDYVVTVTNRTISSNSWATAFAVTDRTASSFTIKLFNSHWSGGAIGAGNIIDWAVFKVV